jgi:1,4-dihydroxy-2-naphthoate octaprenyltransferase
VGTGLIASALLMANNLRDIPTDKEAGKITLAVRLGDPAARISYVMMLTLALLLPLVMVSTHAWMWLILLTVPLCVLPSWTVLRKHESGALIPVLKQTGIINLAYAALFTVAIVMGPALA